MPGLFARLNKARDARFRKKNAADDLTDALPKKPRWDDAHARTSVEPEEIHELLRCCTEELKSRGMIQDSPYQHVASPLGTLHALVAHNSSANRLVIALQVLTTHFSFCLSGLPPTRVRFAHSFDISSTMMNP